MSIGKKLLVYSPRDPQAIDLVAATADWGCMVTVVNGLDEFRGKVEGGNYDLVLTEDSSQLKQLVEEAEPEGSILQTPLAEVEKRHIYRVLSSTGGNKTRAAKILGIDTKTLYNKLKAYNAAENSPQRNGSAIKATG